MSVLSRKLDIWGAVTCIWSSVFNSTFSVNIKFFSSLLNNPLSDEREMSDPFSEKTFRSADFIRTASLFFVWIICLAAIWISSPELVIEEYDGSVDHHLKN